jgi:hypothetical protein
VHEADSLVEIMWDAQHLTILYASTACYGDIFTLLTFLRKREEGSTDGWRPCRLHANLGEDHVRRRMST